MKCLILSQGPVPAPEHTKVEGGGLRCWGLAKGLKENDKNLSITVAYHDSYRQKAFTENYQGIDLVTWNLNAIPELLKDYDTIIVSYCMGDLSIKVADVVRPDQQLILDCYVPIYVEVSARDTNDIDREQAAFHEDVGKWAHVLRRGDVFLCASQTQKRYYQGVLSALGRVNPVTYGEDFIKVVPYGIYRETPKASEKPISKLIGNKKARKVLWFGGIYPWFDLRTLVDAIKIANEHVPMELVIVGAKNPFNNHPDFIRPYEELVAYVSADPELKQSVVFQDWVQFDKRADWYLDSDLVVVINKEGDENELAWRTRLVDFLWADLPIITNGGDPLGETLIQGGAALRFHELNAEGISKDLVKALTSQTDIDKLKKSLNKLRSNFYWNVVTKELTDVITSQYKAADLEEYGDYTIAMAQPKSKLAKARTVVSKAKMVPAYAQKHGLKNTYYVIRTKVKNRLHSRLGTGRTEPGVVMVAHQLDFSGAPYVFMDLAEATVKSAAGKPVEFHTFNPAAKENLTRLNKMGIKPNIHIIKEIEIPYLKGDVVVLNTVAHSSVLKHSLYAGLENGSLERLVWFIHEDEPELIFKSKERDRIARLLKADKITLFIAAQKTLDHYRKVFNNERNIKLQPYKYVIPEYFQKVRSEKDFNKLSFILPGTIGDGRKGQLPIFYAFADFYKNHYAKDPSAYRDFELVFVGVADDFLSRQIIKHSQLLQGKFKHYGRVTHERSSKLMVASNMTICYSLRECLPLFVFEGMAAGHPILRNDSSGIDEQLFEGKNGFYLDSNKYEQVVDTIEVVLNTSKTTNKKLAHMSAFSNKVALDQANHSYQPMVDEILGKESRKGAI